MFGGNAELQPSISNVSHWIHLNVFWLNWQVNLVSKISKWYTVLPPLTESNFCEVY
jgi:hypothetical protein